MKSISPMWPLQGRKFNPLKLLQKLTISPSLSPLRALLLASLSLFAFSNANAAVEKKLEPIRIQDLEKEYGIIESYIIEILGLAIKKSGEAYILEKLSGEPVPQARQIFELSQSRGKFDVIWTMTSDERESQILPIRIPIDKGLFGWRIAFVLADKVPTLKAVKTMADLAKLRAGQGYLWPDTEILKQNGLSVVTGSDDNLANMLKAKRFDYFPRPVIAIWNEQKNQNEYKDLIINDTFILHYPTAFYFFVAPNQKRLAEVITKGLERSIADGSFELVFNKYFKTLIQQTDIKNRLIFELENPLIKSTSLPLNRHSLWYKP